MFGNKILPSGIPSAKKTALKSNNDTLIPEVKLRLRHSSKVLSDISYRSYAMNVFRAIKSVHRVLTTDENIATNNKKHC